MASASRRTTDAHPSSPVGWRVLELVPAIPRLVWGRDEARTGDMWNSNSITAWLLVQSGIDARLAHVPAGGRAPGWNAGLALARLDADHAEGSGDPARSRAAAG
jgi:hypothetical protein